MCIYKSIGLPDNIDTGKFVQLVYSQNIGLPGDIETGKFEHRVQKTKVKENFHRRVCVLPCVTGSWLQIISLYFLVK